MSGTRVWVPPEGATESSRCAICGHEVGQAWCHEHSLDAIDTIWSWWEPDERLEGVKPCDCGAKGYPSPHWAIDPHSEIIHPPYEVGEVLAVGEQLQEHSDGVLRYPDGQELSEAADAACDHLFDNATGIEPPEQMPPEAARRWIEVVSVEPLAQYVDVDPVPPATGRSRPYTGWAVTAKGVERG